MDFQKIAIFTIYNYKSIHSSFERKWNQGADWRLRHKVAQQEVGGDPMG